MTSSSLARTCGAFRQGPAYGRFRNFRRTAGCGGPWASFPLFPLRYGIALVAAPRPGPPLLGLGPTEEVLNHF